MALLSQFATQLLGSLSKRHLKHTLLEAKLCIRLVSHFALVIGQARPRELPALPGTFKVFLIHSSVMINSLPFGTFVD